MGSITYLHTPLPPLFKLDPEVCCVDGSRKQPPRFPLKRELFGDCFTPPHTREKCEKRVITPMSERVRDLEGEGLRPGSALAQSTCLINHTISNPLSPRRLCPPQWLSLVV